MFYLRCNLNAAMELLLSGQDIDTNTEETPVSWYSHNGPFIPFRQFRQQYFQPNPIVKKKSFNQLKNKFF